MMTALASIALVALTACGNVLPDVENLDVTRVPEMSDAAAQATRDAASGAAATPAGGTAEAPSGSPTGGTAPPAQGAATPVTITSHDIFFEPTELTIPANTDVTISLPNEGAAAHNFSIDDLGVSVDLPPGETQEVVINAPAGTYEFYCNVPGHKEAGMVGTLTVSAEAAAPAAEAPAAATPAAASSVATPTGATPVAPATEATAPVTASLVAGSPAAGGAGATASAPVEVVSHDIFFEPKELSIPANTDVVVSLPNEGVTMHDFSIDQLGISVDIQPGATEQTVINAPPGTYEYYCNVPGHKQAGMVGTLTVE
jgi:uncharacterized cupredoxin-like copper-binding protein